MSRTLKSAFFAILFVSLLSLLPALSACSSSSRSTRDQHEEKLEEARRERMIEWGRDIHLEPVEGRQDTITFHVGSPLFIRLRFDDDQYCQPFNGQPFYFDMGGAQLGWGFEEVTDSLLYPRSITPCERIIMLSSEASNRLAEGYYTMKLQIFIDEKRRLYSDTLVLHPVHSRTGADQLSYARFLQEQIVRNSALLTEAETMRALFAEGVPKSAESEIYRAIILIRAGDLAGAEEAIAGSRRMEQERGRPLSKGLIATRDGISRRLAGDQ